MAKRKQTRWMTPGMATRQRKANGPPTSERRGKDSSIIKYNVLASTSATKATGGFAYQLRVYTGGYAGNLSSPSGPAICSYYSTYRFLPGTTVRWEPSVSFSTSGRVYVGFTDNPEQILYLLGLQQNIETKPNGGDGSTDYSLYADVVKGMGNVVSFPVWQETDIPFPSRCRRKRFDVNTNMSTVDANVYDRSAQTAMFMAAEGMPTGALTIGQFRYHDVVDVEGINLLSV
nr:MAG: coat protein [Sanya tombus-like virus 6]